MFSALNPAAFIARASIGALLVGAICLLALIVQGGSLTVIGACLAVFVAVVVCVPDDALPAQLVGRDDKQKGA